MGDADLRSPETVKQSLHRIVRRSSCSQGRTLRKTEYGKRKLDDAAWGYACGYAAEPCARSLVTRHVLSSRELKGQRAGARHEVARNGSDQSTAIRWRSLAQTEPGNGFAGRIAPPAISCDKASGLWAPHQGTHLFNAAAPNLGTRPVARCHLRPPSHRRRHDGIADSDLHSHNYTLYLFVPASAVFEGCCTPMDSVSAERRTKD